MENSAQNIIRQQNQNDDFIQIKDFLSLCLSRWYWFVVSVVITMAIGFAYLLRTPNVYTRTAELLIKEETKSKSVEKSFQNAVEDMGMGIMKSKVENELIIMQSPKLMMEVVKRLHLDMQYFTDGKFHKILLYGTTLPYVVSIAGLDENQSASFTVKVKGDNIDISEVVGLGVEENQKVSYKGIFDQPIKTPLGAVTVSKLDCYVGPVISTLYVVKKGVRAASTMFSGKVSVSQVESKADILRLTCKDVSTQRAEDILNTLILVYNESWVDDKNKITISTSMFIDDRLKIIEEELGSVDNDISSYKSEHLVSDVNAASKLYMQQSTETSKMLQDLQTQQYMIRYVRNYLTSASNKNQLLPANTGITNVSIEKQIGEYNEKLLQRNNIVSNSSTSNPLVVDMDHVLEAMASAILNSIDNQLISLNAKIKTIQQQERETNAQMAANPDQAKYLMSVERQQKIKETLYLFLLQKREENELSQAFTAYNTRIITPAMGGSTPSAPNKRNILLVAFVIGLMIPVVILFLKENLNTVVRGRKDVEKLTLPFAGEIPLFAKKKRFKKQNDEAVVVVQRDKRNSINEAFRVLRTNMEFMMKNDNSKVLLLTSYNQGSGKTFLSMNMAISFAIKGKRVLVVDGDLRHATLSKYVDTPKQGLSNYLGQQFSDWHDVIVKYPDFENLDIIPAGVNPPNPTELIGSDLFAQFMAEIRNEYDYIIMDCPPIDIVADTQIIENFVDRSLFVVRVGLMERSLLEDLEKMYVGRRFKNMALILNGSQENNGKYGYRYGYHYGYYYGHYHYYSEKDNA
ncbi:MAG: polysaccharide biosynthesis tyrosine autokinase [Bacteroidales bacterium]|nr:polysaccharide biosynthesis tyrosine autokinase [Bacteroidales bacterium]